MDYRHLMLSQRQALGRRLGSSGLNPGDFTWKELERDRGDGGPWPGIVHRPTDFWVLFCREYQMSSYSTRVKDKGHCIVYSPGLNEMQDAYGPLKDWDDVCIYFDEWLKNLRREIEAKDFWEVATATFEVGLGAVERPSDTFTEAEAQAITPQLDELESQLTNLETVHELDVKVIQGEEARDTAVRSDQAQAGSGVPE